MRYLLQRSGIKRIKRLEDFDWKFNPHLLRNEIMAFSESCWNSEIKNLVLIGPSGVGKSHFASAICYKAIQKGIPTAFISCFDLINKLKTSTNKHTMLLYYSTVKLYAWMNSIMSSQPRNRLMIFFRLFQNDLNWYRLLSPLT